MAYLTFNSNTGGAAQRQDFDGRPHLVVPVTMIVEGVLNGALVTREVMRLHTDAWNGRPVPILHPEENGEYISANRADILQRCVGFIQNAHVEGDRLLGDAWIDINKSDAHGPEGLTAALEAGETIEISTGYLSYNTDVEGEFNGKPYERITNAIIPDHLALLPGQIGACSVADGCGTWQNVVNAWNKFFNVNNGGRNMAEKLSICERKKALVTNVQLTPEQLSMLLEMDDETLTVVEAIAAGIKGSKPTEAEAPDPVEMAAMVDQAVRRNMVTAKLQANTANIFKPEQLVTMEVATLEAYEQSIRVADYAGQGGAPVTVTVNTDDSQPYVPAGVLLGGDK